MRTYGKHRELYFVLCGDLNGKEIQEKIDLYTLRPIHSVVQ